MQYRKECIKPFFALSSQKLIPPWNGTEIQHFFLPKSPHNEIDYTWFIVVMHIATCFSFQHKKDSLQKNQNSAESEEEEWGTKEITHIFQSVKNRAFNL